VFITDLTNERRLGPVSGSFTVFIQNVTI